jgi:hypothetical protein
LSAKGGRYRVVVDTDLEGIVAKRLTDAYQPKLARRQQGRRATQSAAGALNGFRERGGFPMPTTALRA